MTVLGEEHGFLEVEPHDPRDRRADREVILLLHGLGGSKDDWRFPITRGLHHDLSHAPPDRHDDNHLIPPLSPLDHLPEFGLSPMRTGVRCWTGVLKSLGHTVINYSQDGPQSPVEAPLAQFERRIVPFLRNDVLSGQLAGKRVVVICHSRGGILARAYLHRNPGAGSEWIGRVITLCSPHQGTKAPGAKQRLADAAAVIGAGTVLGANAPVADVVLKVAGVLGESAGAEQLLPGDPLFAELAAPAEVPDVQLRTIGGTSVRYARIYAYFFAPESYLPNWSDFPDIRFDWTKVPIEIPLASPLLDALPNALVDDEQDDGRGDGLVADSRARISGAPHESLPLNHVEALWDERLFARVAALLGTPLSGDERVDCGREPRGLIVQPSAVTFGSVDVGEIASRTVRIENTSGDRVRVQLAASPPGVFRWPAVDSVLPGGEALTLPFTFRPVDKTIRTEQVRVTSAATNGPHTISLTGKGIGGLPTPPPDPPLPTRLRFSTRVLTFGSVRVNDTETRVLVIANGTGRSVRVQIARSATGAVFQWPALDVRIPHGTERRVTVSFRPATNTISNGQLVVNSDTPISPETIALTGKGGIGGFPTPPG